MVMVKEPELKTYFLGQRIADIFFVEGIILLNHSIQI